MYELAVLPALKQIDAHVDRIRVDERAILFTVMMALLGIAQIVGGTPVVDVINPPRHAPKWRFYALMAAAAIIGLVAAHFIDAYIEQNGYHRAPRDFGRP